MSDKPQTTLYTRSGVPFEGTVHYFPSGKRFYTFRDTCRRCGGAGRSDRWAHTGYTCYQCGGSGAGAEKSAPLYTAEQLAKLNAAADKRRTKKAEAAAAAALQREIEAGERRVAFHGQHGELLVRMRRFISYEGNEPRSEFIEDVYQRAMRTAAISAGQITAVVKVMDAIDAEDARKAATTHVGVVGEKIAFTATVQRVLDLGESQFNHYQRNYLIALRTEGGCAVSYIGSRHYDLSEGDKVAVSATVKCHGEYRDEPQTKIMRPKFEVIEHAEEAS